MSEGKWKRLVKTKTAQAGFKYLKEKISGQNIAHIRYIELAIQEYLLDGNVNTKMSQLIFKARSMTLDIKMQKKWKFSDSTCVGCGVNDETGQEILSCDSYVDGREEEMQKVPLLYSIFYFGTPSEMYQLAKVMHKKLETRNKLMEEMPG